MELILNPNWSQGLWLELLGEEWQVNFIAGSTDVVFSTNGTTIVKAGDIIRITQVVGQSELLIERVATPVGRTIVNAKLQKGDINYTGILKVEIFNGVDSYYLDGTFDLAINLRIFDLKEGKRSSAFTKTIEIPFSENNNRVFNQLFNVNAETGYNPKLKSDAYISDGGVLISSGYLQVQDIDVEEGIYKCVFYGENKNLFDDIGDKLIYGNANTLDNIDFSDIAYPRYRAEVEDGWAGNRDMVLGLIETNNDNYIKNYMLGTGGYAGVESDRWRPWVRVKKVLDKIFSKHNYTYTSNFLNSQQFKKLFCLPSGSVSPNPYSSSNTNNSFFYYDQEFAATYSIDISGNYNVNKTNQVIATNIKNDAAGAWNTAAYEFTAPYDDIYTFSMMVNFDATPQRGYGPDPNQQVVSAQSNNALGSIKIIPVIIRNNVEIFRNLNWYSKSEYQRQDNFGSGLTFRYRIWNEPIIKLEVFNQYLDASNPNMKLLKGDKVKFYMDINPSPTNALVNPAPSSYVINNTNTTNYSIFSISVNPYDFVAGYNTNDFDNPTGNFNNVKQSDFVGDIFKMFNLYIKPDKNKQRNFLIEPRDDFYESGNVISDLEYDINTANISFLSELAAKKYIYTYSPGNDDNNKLFQDNNKGRAFGDAIVDLNNDFLKNEIKVELKASPTIVLPNFDDFYLPNIKISGSNDKLRFLYYNGRADISSWGYNFKYIFNSANGSQTTATYSYYPAFDYYSNLRDRGSESILFSLSRDLLKENSLYYNYYENEIETINYPNSHILTLNIRMNSGIWSRIDYNDVYYFEINGNPNYYTLLSIENYNPQNDSIVKAKFLSYFKDFGGLTPKRTEPGNEPGGGVTPGGGGDEVMMSFAPSSGGVIGGDGALILGENSKNVIWSGDNLALGGSNQNIFVLGDDATIQKGANNVFIFGSSNATITGTGSIVSWGGEIGTSYSVADQNHFKFNEFNPVFEEKIAASVSNPTSGMMVYEGNKISVYDNTNNWKSIPLGGDVGSWTWSLASATDYGATSSFYNIGGVTSDMSGDMMITTDFIIISGGNAATPIIEYKLVIDNGDRETTTRVIDLTGNRRTAISFNEYIYVATGEAIDLYVKSDDGTGFGLKVGTNMIAIKNK